MANFLNADHNYKYFDGITLKKEQIEMIEYGLTKYNCILNGKVGVGKTICGLAIAKTILDKTSNVACFVLCPKAANTAFFKEFKRMNTPVSVVITEQKSIVKGSKYFLFNQSNVLDMVTWLYALKERGYRVILLCDEVHFMQSADSNVSDTVRKVRSQFTCVIGMTGTPLLQELEGLFRVVDFVRPGYLGTFTDFTNRYINYREKIIYLKGNRRRKVKEVMSYKNLPELRERLKGIIIVRGRDYDIQYHYYTTTLSEPEQDLYEEASKGIINEGETERQESARLHDLQRVVDGSHKKSDKNILSSKQQLLVNTCREIVQRGEGTLIYTEYEDTYTTLGRVLKKYRSYIGFDKLYYITGKTSTEDRYMCEKNLKEKDIAIVTRAGCFSKGTKVIMSDGSLKNIEDICVGDYVMGRNSIPRKVTNLIRGTDTMYSITQSNAQSYTVNSQHILSLVYNQSRKEFGFSKGDILNITVDDFMAKSQNFRNHFSGFKEGYDSPDIDLKLNPYALGLWLGDGDKYHSALYIADTEQEIADWWEDYGKSLGLHVRSEKGSGCAKFILTSGVNGKPNPFTQGLRFYNLLGNKHIPEIYFSASRNQRLQLFAGLINTDGWKHRESLCLSSSIKELALQYKRLGDSLGYKTRISEYKRVGFGKERTIYRVGFVGHFEDVPYLIPRKIPQVRRDFKTYNWSRLKIEEVGVGNYYGIEIDGPDRLFLLEDGTVVHNCQAINLQGVNNVIIYNTSFSIGWIIQMIGRITRTDTKYPKLHVYFLEVSETIDTYKRLLFQDHALLIKEVLGKEPILPDFTEVNPDLMKKYRSYFKRKLLWCK